LATIVIALATAVAAGVGLATYFVLGGQLAEMKTQRRLDQRAWIGVEAMDPIPSIPTIGSKFEVAIRIRNSGKTPARNLISVGRDDTMRISDAPPFSYDGIEKDNAGTIAPNAIATIPIKPMRDNTTGKEYIFSMSNISLLLLQQTRIYVSGLITYDDIFRRPHWTTYCAWLSVPFNGQFNRCETHNDTDDYPE
jgi:hypothetical protein